MTEALWVIVSLMGLWIVVVWLFVALSHGKALLEQGELSWFWQIPLYLALPIFLCLDVIWNVVIGTLCFAELPRELLFTSRVSRHVEHAGGWRYEVAAWWAVQINTIDPGHISD